MNAWSARINVPVKIESCADEECQEAPIEEAYFYVDFEPTEMENGVDLSTKSNDRNGDMDATLYVEWQA